MEDITEKGGPMSVTRKTTEQKLAELAEKKAQLEARIKQESAKLKSAERKKDTRRKVIAGALALEHAQRDPAFKATLMKLIGDNVSRQEDRALFENSP
jgi:hypothetical protein